MNIQRTWIEKPIAFEMVSIPPGEFTIASGKSTLKVTLTRGFSISTTAITWQQIAQVTNMESEEALYEGRVARSVSPCAAVNFCNRLSARNGLELAYSRTERSFRKLKNRSGYYIPTRAESIWALCGGNRYITNENIFKFSEKEDVNRSMNNGPYPTWLLCAAGLRIRENGEEYIVAGQSPANAFGVKDVHGTQGEMVFDSIESNNIFNTFNNTQYFNTTTEQEVIDPGRSGPKGSRCGIVGRRMVSQQNLNQMLDELRPSPVLDKLTSMIANISTLHYCGTYGAAFRIIRYTN